MGKGGWLLIILGVLLIGLAAFLLNARSPVLLSAKEGGTKGLICKTDQDCQAQFPSWLPLCTQYGCNNGLCQSEKIEGCQVDICGAGSDSSCSGAKAGTECKGIAGRYNRCVQNQNGVCSCVTADQCITTCNQIFDRVLRSCTSLYCGFDSPSCIECGQGFNACVTCQNGLFAAHSECLRRC